MILVLIFNLYFFQIISLTQEDSLNFSYKELYSSKNKIEFYSKIDVAINQNNEVFVLDIGNKNLLKLDSNFQEIQRYEKEGTGPGEFDLISNLIITKNRLIVNGLKSWLFDFKLNFKGEIFFPVKVGIYEENQQIKIAESARSGNFKTIGYSLDGKQLTDVAIQFSGFINKKEQEDDKNLRHVNLIQFNQAKLQLYSGEYAFSVIYEGNYLRYTRYYDRQRYDNFEDIVFYIDGGADAKKHQAELIEGFIKTNGGFRHDITSLIGSFNQFLFLKTSTNLHRTLKFDMIDLVRNHFKQFQFDFKERVTHARIYNNMLIVILNSETSGPYFNIYELGL